MFFGFSKKKPGQGPGFYIALLRSEQSVIQAPSIPQFRILASAGAINLTLLTFLMPVTAIFLGTVLFGESVRPIDIMGMTFIGLALVIIDGCLLRKLRR